MHNVPQILISISANFLYQLLNLSSRYSTPENDGPFPNKHYVITSASKEEKTLMNWLRSLSSPEAGRLERRLHRVSP